MSSQALIAPLRAIELFQGLKPLQVTEIARRADRIVFKAGDVIVKRDTDGDAAILVVSGEALRLAHPFDADARDETLPVGCLLSEMAMLIETRYASTIVAKTPVRALRIKRSELLAQMEEDPTLADHLVQQIGARLHVIASELRDIDERLSKPFSAGPAHMSERPTATAPTQALH